MVKERIYGEKEIIEILKKTSRHDMNSKVCKGCNQSHHYIVCPYDFIMTLNETGKLNKLFETSLQNNPKEEEENR